jgi:hypothetical protein
MITFILMTLVTVVVLGGITARITWANLDRKQRELFMYNVRVFKYNARKFIKERV